MCSIKRTREILAFKMVLAKQEDTGGVRRSETEELRWIEREKWGSNEG